MYRSLKDTMCAFPSKYTFLITKNLYIFNPVLQLNPSNSSTSSVQALPTSWHSQGGHEDPEHPLRRQWFCLPAASTTRGRTFGSHCQDWEARITAQFSRFGSHPHHPRGSLLQHSGTQRHAPPAEPDPSRPAQSGAGTRTRGAGGERGRGRLTSPLAEPALPSTMH